MTFKGSIKTLSIILYDPRQGDEDIPQSLPSDTEKHVDAVPPPPTPPGANFLSSLTGAHKHWCTFGGVGFASHLVFFSIIKAPLMSNLLYHLA